MPPPPIGPPRVPMGGNAPPAQGVIRPPPPKMLPSAVAESGRGGAPPSRPQSPAGRPGIPSAPPPNPPPRAPSPATGSTGTEYSSMNNRPLPPPAQNTFAGNGSAVLSPPPPTKAPPGPPPSRPASNPAPSYSYGEISNDSITLPRTPNPSFAYNASQTLEAHQVESTSNTTSVPPEASNNAYSQQSSAAPSANIRATLQLQEQIDSLRLEEPVVQRRNSLPPSASTGQAPQPQPQASSSNYYQVPNASAPTSGPQDSATSINRRPSAPPSVPVRPPPPTQQQSPPTPIVAPQRTSSSNAITLNYVPDADQFNAEAEARAQQAMRKNALEIVEDVCPFSQREHKVQVLYEIGGGLNYAEVERLKQARSSVPRIMAALARKEIFESLSEITNTMVNGNDGVRVEQQDVWVQLRPGQLQSAFLSFDGAGGVTGLADADWPLRVYVAVRCQYEDANDIAMALQCFAEEPDAFAQIVRVYQQQTRRLVTPLVNVIDMATPTTVVGVRDPGARGRTSLTTVLPNANSPFRSTTPVQGYRAQTPTRGGSMNVHMVGVGGARAVADEVDGRVYVTRGPSQPASTTADKQSSTSAPNGMTGRGVSPNRSLGSRPAGRQLSNDSDGGEEYFLKVSEVPRYVR